MVCPKRAPPRDLMVCGGPPRPSFPPSSSMANPLRFSRLGPVFFSLFRACSSRHPYSGCRFFVHLRCLCRFSALAATQQPLPPRFDLRILPRVCPWVAPAECLAATSTYGTFVIPRGPFSHLISPPRALNVSRHGPRPPHRPGGAQRWTFISQLATSSWVGFPRLPYLSERALQRPSKRPIPLVLIG